MVTDGGCERCYHVYGDGETVNFHVNDRWTVLRRTRTRGRAPPISKTVYPFGICAGEGGLIGYGNDLIAP